MWFLFLNIVISDEYYLNSFNRMKDDTKFGFVKPNPEDTAVMVEYSSPNTNKPLHLMFVITYSGFILWLKLLRLPVKSI
jgi:hypothetical protein